MKELVDIFFNPLNFEKFLLENKEETIDANEKKGGSGTQTSGDDNDETMSANNDGEIIGHDSDPKIKFDEKHTEDYDKLISI